MTVRALYICYFGIHEPLVQTQVIPYLKELLKDGHEIVLLTFEPRERVAKLKAGDAATWKMKLAEQGIEWRWLRYHKRFSVLATAYDVAAGSLFSWRMIGNRRLDIIHARVHIPMLIASIARKFSRLRPKLLFDIRGFMPEEYTDAGIWSEGGLLYRTAKRIEHWLMNEADGFVILTEKAREILFPESKQTGYDRHYRPIEVIPCCIDLERFKSVGNEADRIRMRNKFGLSGRRVVVHLGALGGLYLTEQIADFLGMLRERDESTFAMFLTQSDPEKIVPLLKARGFSEADFLVTRVAPEEVPRLVELANIALSFVRAGYATQSRSPTKIPEYLICGVPVVANTGVGDVDSLLRDNGVGALVKDFSIESYFDAINDLAALGDVYDRCRDVAIREFDITTVGGTRYRKLYRRIMGSTAKS